MEDRCAASSTKNALLEGVITIEDEQEEVVVVVVEAWFVVVPVALGWPLRPPMVVVSIIIRDGKSREAALVSSAAIRDWCGLLLPLLVS